MTKMPLKGIRARLTRHGDSLSAIKARLRSSEAKIAALEQLTAERWLLVVDRINAFREYIGKKLP